ncbi:MAG: LytTR family DNA-binding domain-containing protein [Bacteroidota bacterium]
MILGKDHLHASLNHYSFYAGESLLFGSFYLFFFAFYLFYRRLFSKARTRLVFLLPLVFTATHLITFAIFVKFSSVLFFTHGFGFVKTFKYAFFEHGLLSLFVYSLFLFISSHQPSKLITQSPPKEDKKISVMYKEGFRILHLHEVLYVKAERPYIAIITKEKKYLRKQSLKAFLEEHAEQDFIQIHKSLLINTSYLRAYTSRKNGDYDLVLAGKHQLRASRSYRANFLPFLNDLA